MKPHFITDLNKVVIIPFVENNKWNGTDWILCTTIVIRLNKRLLFIPSGFVTNFGSIPKAVRFFLNRMGKSLRAFVVHDWIYSILKGVYVDFNTIKQRDCDSILYELSRFDGESWFDAQSINKGLALGGWTCYKKSEPIVSDVSESVMRYMAECNGYKLKKEIEQ